MKSTRFYIEASLVLLGSLAFFTLLSFLEIPPFGSAFGHPVFNSYFWYLFLGDGMPKFLYRVVNVMPHAVVMTGFYFFVRSGFLNQSLNSLKKIAVFRGCAGLDELWQFLGLLFFVVYVGYFVACGLAARLLDFPSWSCLSVFVRLGIFCLLGSLMVRRLHDVGNRGWWVLSFLNLCLAPEVFRVFSEFYHISGQVIILEVPVFIFLGVWVLSFGLLCLLLFRRKSHQESGSQEL